MFGLVCVFLGQVHDTVSYLLRFVFVVKERDSAACFSLCTFANAFRVVHEGAHKSDCLSNWKLRTNVFLQSQCRPPPRVMCELLLDFRMRPA